MIRSVYLEDETLSRDLTPEAIAATLKSRAGVLWLDLPPGERHAEILREVFGFHPLAIEDCTHSHVEMPKIDDYGDYLFIVAQSVGYTGHTEQLQLAEIDMFLGPNYIVTSRQVTSTPIDNLFERACESRHVLNRGADFLAHTVLDSLVDPLLPAVEIMDEHIDDLEQRILDNPDRRLLPEVMLIKRNVQRLRRTILPERDMVNRLSRGEFGALIRPEALIFFRDVYDHIVRVEEMLEGLRDVAEGALSSYLSAINIRMNEVMKTLSIVTVIFLPLTLVAGIYGTNLDYAPFGLTLAAGFWLMLATMLLIAASVALYFRRRGWF